MKTKIYLLLALLILATTSCKKEEPLLYDANETKLYFHYGQYVKDSLVYTFFSKKPELMQDFVLVQINTMGAVRDVDRPIKIVQLNEGESDAAQEGIHYVPFDNPELQKLNVVQGDSTHLQFAIAVIRDPSLETKTVRLKFGIEDNEHFKKGIDKYQTYVVKITSLAAKPANWDGQWRYAFGPTWGSAKMKFIIDELGITDWEESISISLLFYYRSKCLAAFVEYNDANPDNPLREADTGELVTFEH